MVQAEQVQDRGVQVVDVQPVFDGAQAEFVGRRRSSDRLSTPPPAIHMVKPVGLWSRPLPFSLIGVRPNSPPQTTSVSSSSPRRFQILAAGRRRA